MTRGQEERKSGRVRRGPVGFGAVARQREIGRPETPRVRRVSGVWLAMAGLAAGSERTRRGRGDGVGARCARRTPWVRVGLMRGWFGRGRTHPGTVHLNHWLAERCHPIEGLWDEEQRSCCGARAGIATIDRAFLIAQGENAHGQGHEEREPESHGRQPSTNRASRDERARCVLCAFDFRVDRLPHAASTLCIAPYA